MSTEQHPAKWTDARVARLEALWSQGFSSEQIATDLGGVTRNAVIGKAARLGLTRSADVRAQNHLAANRVRTAPPKAGAGTRAGSAVHQAEPTTSPRQKALDAIAANEAARSAARAAEPEPALGEVVPLERLGPHACRWPIGEPSAAGFGFCGRRRDDGATYCPTHAKAARAAVQPPRPRASPVAGARAAFRETW